MLLVAQSMKFTGTAQVLADGLPGVTRAKASGGGGAGGSAVLVALDTFFGSATISTIGGSGAVVPASTAGGGGGGYSVVIAGAGTDAPSMPSTAQAAGAESGSVERVTNTSTEALLRLRPHQVDSLSAELHAIGASREVHAGWSSGCNGPIGLGLPCLTVVNVSAPGAVTDTHFFSAAVAFTGSQMLDSGLALPVGSFASVVGVTAPSADWQLARRTSLPASGDDDLVLDDDFAHLSSSTLWNETVKWAGSGGPLGRSSSLILSGSVWPTLQAVAPAAPTSLAEADPTTARPLPLVWRTPKATEHETAAVIDPEHGATLRLPLSQPWRLSHADEVLGTEKAKLECAGATIAAVSVSDSAARDAHWLIGKSSGDAQTGFALTTASLTTMG